MHPPLAKHRHPQCVDAIDALHNCHNDKPIAKFFGGCNKEAKILDDCLYAEYLDTIASNKRKKQEKKELRHRERQTKEPST
mmetsp:Transcript_12171/g.15171  ORF Transcript_12171/g.15171 Transcript_12171/m.15171 type:complete len:81 (-) Transcript_12171:117-359(-)